MNYKQKVLNFLEEINFCTPEKLQLIKREYVTSGNNSRSIEKICFDEKIPFDHAKWKQIEKKLGLTKPILKVAEFSVDEICADNNIDCKEPLTELEQQKLDKIEAKTRAFTSRLSHAFSLINANNINKVPQRVLDKRFAEMQNCGLKRKLEIFRQHIEKVKAGTKEMQRLKYKKGYK